MSKNKPAPQKVATPTPAADAAAQDATQQQGTEQQQSAAEQQPVQDGAAGAAPVIEAPTQPANKLISGLASDKPSDIVTKAAEAAKEVANTQSYLMASIGPTLTKYQDIMDPTKGVSEDQIREQQLALYRLVRDVVKSPTDFQEGMQLLVSAFGSKEMTALAAPYLYRGFDAALGKLPVQVQRLARSLFTMLDIAGGAASPAGVHRLYDLKSGLNHEVLTGDDRQRLVSFFS